MIPKVIHYCWFGGNPIPQELQLCIDSWQATMPDWEIILWNEDNTHLLQNAFVKEALAARKFAFASDYIRLKVLEEYGGVYLDTDMYFIKPLNKLVGSYDFFISCEDENYISAGVIGCIPHHSFIREALTFYDKTEFDIEKLTTIPKVLTTIYKDKYPASSHDFSKVIQLDGGVILPKEYFYPFSLTKALELETNFKKYITAETFAIHLWNHSWFGGGFIEFDYLKKRKFFKSLQILVRRTYNNKGISRSYYTRFNQLFFKFLKKYSKEQLKLVSRKFFLSND